MTDDTHDNDTPAEGVREPEQQGSDEVAASGKENYAEHLARASVLTGSFSPKKIVLAKHTGL